MGDGAAAMNQQRTVNAVRTASKIPVSGRGLSPSAGPYLELFARETKPGWKCWGRFGFSRDTSATLTLSRCPPAIGVTRRAIPSCCRGFVCYVCAFITRAQRAGISDTCDAASGRCCVQTTPAAAAFGGTLAGWPPPRSRLFGEEASKLGGGGLFKFHFHRWRGFATHARQSGGGRHWEAFLSKSLYGATERRETPFRWAARIRLPKRRWNQCNPPRNSAGRSSVSR
jgi:hypothetical protein